MVNSPAKNHANRGLLLTRQNGVGGIKVIKSPSRNNANRGSLTFQNGGDRKGFGLIGQGSKRKIWAVESQNYTSYGIRHLEDDEETSSTTCAYSSPYSIETDNPAVQQDQEHSFQRIPPPPPPPPPPPRVSSDCEESNSGDAHWTCVACTFVNTNADFLSCEVCSQSRTKEPADTCPIKGCLTPANRDKYMAQQTCIQVQKEKIVQVEERALLDERMKEIIEMQQELFAEIEQEQRKSNNNDNSNITRPSLLSSSASMRNLQETQTKIDDLHQQLLIERSDQVQVELELRASRRNIFQPQQQINDDHVSSSCEVNEHLEQERMLLSWKGQWDERNESLAQISQFQKELEDTFAQHFAL